MADDLRKKADDLRARLGTSAKRPELGSGQPPRSAQQALNELLGSIGGGTPESRRLLASGKVEEAAQVEAASSVVEVYFIADATGSMAYGIDEVRGAIDEIGRDLFREGAQTRIAVWALYDHGALNREGLRASPLTPLLQDVRGMQQAFGAQIRGLDVVDSGNMDIVENYECGWRRVAEEMARSQERDEYKGKQVRRVVVTCMETAAHGQLEELAKDCTDPALKSELQIAARTYDYGCGQGTHWRTALNAAKMLSSGKGGQWYVVDCKGSYGNMPVFKHAKQSCVTPGVENERLITLDDARGIMPKLLIGMTEATRGPASLLQYVEQVQQQDPAAAVTLAGYLPAPRILQQRPKGDVDKR